MAGLLPILLSTTSALPPWLMTTRVGATSKSPWAWAGADKSAEKAAPAISRRRSDEESDIKDPSIVTAKCKAHCGNSPEGIGKQG